MAEVTSMSHSPTSMYFPSVPPSVPKAVMSYSKSVGTAPYTALQGVVVDGRQPSRHTVTPRCRVRKQVGNTNRWRLPESLGSDLLGTAQAVKAIKVPYNSSLINLITAENAKNSCNMNLEDSYSFRLSCDRPAQPSNKLKPVHSTAASTPTATPGFINNTMSPLPQCVPSRARPARPLDVFLYHSKKSRSGTGPDVLLQCLGINWELHRPYLQKSGTLSRLLGGGKSSVSQTRYYRNNINGAQTLDNLIEKNNVYNNDYKEASEQPSRVDVVDTLGTGMQHPKHVSEQRTSNKTVITLSLRDPLITSNALAVALGNLYHETVEVEVDEVLSVLAAAVALEFPHLEHGCTDLMMQNINYSTVSAYHQASSKFNLDNIRVACEHWLEQNLIPELSSQIHLRQLPMPLLQKVINSDRLFTYSEFWVYRTLATWMFLQMNPSMQLMPSYSTVLTFFNSLVKSSSLMERQEGQHFAQLFMAVRFHGVLDTNQIQDIQTMNIIPQTWLVKILNNHYHALQGGGDMSLLTTNAGPIRQGFIIDNEPHYHSEIMSLHGFHFELKAVRREEKGSYSFYMQRLKPGDPILSFRHCERHTFSMRPDREVRYGITVSHFENNHDCQTFNTGMITQRFSVAAKSCKSQVLNVDNLVTPVYVTFALLFPPS